MSICTYLAKVRVIIAGKNKKTRLHIFEKNEFEKSPQSKPKQNWVNHRIGTHWKTPVSSRSPSLLMQIYAC
jgi:hypothetical protein